jgi:hypothetical protein
VNVQNSLSLSLFSSLSLCSWRKKGKHSSSAAVPATPLDAQRQKRQSIKKEEKKKKKRRRRRSKKERN